MASPLVQESIANILMLIKEAKYIDAEQEYNNHLTLFPSVVENNEYDNLFKLMIERASETREVLNDIASSNSNSDDTPTSNSTVISSDWILGMTYLGITTHYKVDDSNYLHFRIDGILENIDIFKAVAVIHEVDLFKEWVPFLSESKLIEKVGVVDMIAYLRTHIPPLSRDTVIHVYGSDCLYNDRVVLIGKSENQWPATAINGAAETWRSVSRDYTKYDSSINSSSTYKIESEVTTQKTHFSSSSSSSVDASINKTSNNSINIPWWPIGWFHNRMEILEFKAVLTILAPDKVETCFIACLDPHAALPRTIVNFVIRNIAGLFLYYFEKQVHKVGKTQDCPYKTKVQNSPEFYQEWLTPKLKEYYNKKGWEYKFHNNTLLDS